MLILKGRKNKTSDLENINFIENICYYWNQTTGAYCLLELELIGNEEEKSSIVTVFYRTLRAEQSDWLIN